MNKLRIQSFTGQTIALLLENCQLGTNVLGEVICIIMMN